MTLRTSEDRRRLLVVSPTALMGGAEIVLMRLVTAAARDGWRVQAACPDGPLVGALEKAGARLAGSIPDLKLRSGPKLWALARLALHTARASRILRVLCRNADVVLVNGIFALPALRIAQPQTPVVWLPHDVVRTSRWRAVVRAGERVVSVAVAVSEAAAEPLRARGLPVEVVRNGTPWPVEPLRDGPTGPPVIGCAALLTPVKGQHVLLEAVALLPDDVRLELVGGRGPKDGFYVAALQRRAAEPDLRERVEFAGHLDDVVERMRSWHIAVLPNVQPEAAPLTPLEAMSLGLPVVASDLGGASEVLGDAGLLVPPEDPGALELALSRLLTDADLWSRCHDAGPRQIVARGLTVDRQMRDLLELLGRWSSTHAGRRLR